MEEVITKLSIRSPEDIYRLYSYAKEKNLSALAGGYISAHEKFITDILSALTQAYLNFLKGVITPEQFKERYEKIYNSFEDEKLQKDIAKDNRWYVSPAYLESSYVEFGNEEDKKQLSVWNVINYDGKAVNKKGKNKQSDIPVFSFYYVPEEVFAPVEEAVSRAVEHFKGKNDREKEGMYYRLLRLLLTFKLYEDAEDLLKGIWQDEEIIRFLEDNKKLQTWLEGLVYENPNLLNNPNEKRVLRFLDDRLRFADWALMWMDEKGEEEERLLLPVLTKFLIGDKKLSPDEVLLRLFTKDELKLYGNMKKEGLIKAARETLQSMSEEIGVDLVYWIEKVYSSEPKGKENEEDKRNKFLAKLDKFLGDYLREVLREDRNLYSKPSKVLRVGKYSKNEELASLKRISIQVKKVFLYVLYGDEKAGKDLVQILTGQPLDKKGKPVLELRDKTLYGRITYNKKPRKLCNMSFVANLDDIRMINIRDVFPFYEKLKLKEDAEMFPYPRQNVISDSEYSKKAFFFLLSVSALFNAMRLHTKEETKEDVEPLVFAVIDTSWRKDEHYTYKFWDIARTLARLLAFPLQTVDAFRSKEGGFFLRPALYQEPGFGIQNLLFSAIRNIRKVDLTWEIKGFNTAQAWNNKELRVYLVLKHISSKLFDYEENINTEFYEVFELIFKRRGKEIDVSVKLSDISDKGIFKIPWYGETVGDIDRVLMSLPPADYVFLISYDKNILEGDSQYYRGYVRQLKTVLLKEQLPNISVKELGRVRKADAVLLYKENMVKFHRLLPTGERAKATLGIHAILPRALLEKFTNNSVISSEINLFWLDEKVQGNPNHLDLFVLTVLSWLIYETDTDTHPYVKPKWIQRRQGSFTLRIKTFAGKEDIPFDITATAMELAQLLKAFSELKKTTS